MTHDRLRTGCRKFTAAIKYDDDHRRMMMEEKKFIIKINTRDISHTFTSPIFFFVSTIFSLRRMK